jgi:hypothetical protein
MLPEASRTMIDFVPEPAVCARRGRNPLRLKAMIQKIRSGKEDRFMPIMFRENPGL